jgi:hypothetical protein
MKVYEALRQAVSDLLRSSLSSKRWLRAICHSLRTIRSSVSITHCWFAADRSSNVFG